MSCTSTNNTTELKQMSSQTAIRLPQPWELDPSWKAPPVIDLTDPRPDDETAIRFQLVEGITGRLMSLPIYSLYTLEFFYADGTRVKDTPRLRVYDVKEKPVYMPTFGEIVKGGYTTHTYTILPERAYEVYYDNVLRKKISFPRTLLVEL
ncbi:hypothetical protein BJ138DRAFT_1114749 [Hygrophoropsis aurantiaca]|uniref:Uncharacterized protein n=1 Tax=Hygrophoropsis aurantiaca TaxID=72124 RepID=A0ACB8A8G7_9AGAM|nr:hypothetical protein BJ138DRAFT_1114749 [Hygrophoropsis aurantiaca]